MAISTTSSTPKTRSSSKPISRLTLRTLPSPAMTTCWDSLSSCSPGKHGFAAERNLGVTVRKLGPEDRLCAREGVLHHWAAAHRRCCGHQCFWQPAVSRHLDSQYQRSQPQCRQPGWASVRAEYQLCQYGRSSEPD